MAENKNGTLMYKGKPLVRCADTIFYGNPEDPFIVKLTINSKKKLKDISLSEKVSTCSNQTLQKQKATQSPKKAKNKEFTTHLTSVRFG